MTGSPYPRKTGGQHFFSLYERSLNMTEVENVQASYKRNYWFCSYRNLFNIWKSGLIMWSGIHSTVHHPQTGKKKTKNLSRHFCLRAAESWLFSNQNHHNQGRQLVRLGLCWFLLSIRWPWALLNPINEYLSNTCFAPPVVIKTLFSSIKVLGCIHAYLNYFDSRRHELCSKEKA